jgi:hypothetical protein
MERQHPYKNEGYGEGRAGDINPREAGRVEPGKRVEEREKLEIRESGLGRDQGQTPADEHIDEHFSQIDSETNWMREQQQQDEAMEQTLAKQFDTEDFKRVDERDFGDSSEEWDAERSRTGRHK